MATADTRVEHELLARLDRTELGAPRRKLMFQEGFGYTVDSFDRALIGLAVAALIVLWDVSDAVGGFMLASVFLGYFIGALGAGVLADRYGRRRLLNITLLTFSVFCAMTAFASEPWHGCVWHALAGLGLGAESVLVAPCVAEFVPSRYRSKFYYLVSVLLARYGGKSVLVGYAAGGAVGAAIVAASGADWQLLIGACLLAAFLNGAAAAYPPPASSSKRPTLTTH